MCVFRKGWKWTLDTVCKEQCHQWVSRRPRLVTKGVFNVVGPKCHISKNGNKQPNIKAMEQDIWKAELKGK